MSLIFIAELAQRVSYKPPHPGNAGLNHSSFPQRLDMLGALREYLVPEFRRLAGYKETISILRTAQRKRNKFVHNSISLHEQTGQVIMAIGSARGTIKTNAQKIAISDVRRAAISINEAQRSLYKLVLGRDTPPSWEKR
jgi:hypothetical protein